jgi:hypothetical protein
MAAGTPPEAEDRKTGVVVHFGDGPNSTPRWCHDAVPFHFAVHEAGHAAAEWLLDGTPYTVQIAAAGETIEDRWGSVQHDAVGLTEGAFNFSPYRLMGLPPSYI